MVVIGFIEAYCKAVCFNKCPISTAKPSNSTTGEDDSKDDTTKCADGDTVSDDCNSARKNIVASCVAYVVPFLFLVYY